MTTELVVKTSKCLPHSFHNYINNLAMVLHSCLEKADGCTRKKHNLKFRHIGHSVEPYGQSSSPKTISAWNGGGPTL